MRLRRRQLSEAVGVSEGVDVPAGGSAVVGVLNEHRYVTSDLELYVESLDWPRGLLVVAPGGRQVVFGRARVCQSSGLACRVRVRDWVRAFEASS